MDPSMKSTEASRIADGLALSDGLAPSQAVLCSRPGPVTGRHASWRQMHRNMSAANDFLSLVVEIVRFVCATSACGNLGLSSASNFVYLDNTELLLLLLTLHHLISSIMNVDRFYTILYTHRRHLIT